MAKTLANELYCDHEWWESTFIGGPHLTQVCRLCGLKRRVQMTPEQIFAAGYKRVKEEAEEE